MNDTVIRLVRPEDASAILAVYAPYVENTAVSFEYVVPSLVEFQRRIEEIAEEYPYLVCEMQGVIAGYAYAHRQLERVAYSWNVELSVYVKDAYIGNGIGKALYGALFSLLSKMGIRNVYALVTVPNAGSEALHQYFGFTQVGLHRNTGYKLGEWRDVAWFEKKLGDFEKEPKPFIKITELPEDSIQAAFEISGNHKTYV